MQMTLFHAAALAALALAAALLYLVLFEPGLPYRINGELPPCSTVPFGDLLAALVDAPLVPALPEVYDGGESFYAAQLQAIANARRCVHLEAYVFHPSVIAERILTAMQERAEAGVHIRLVIDAIGSLRTPDRYFDPLRRAGGEVHWYQPVRWHTLKRFNNRTHRELLVVDGEVGFIGGAGVAAWWNPAETERAWRDTMLRIEGPLARALQASFVENWLESSGELLASVEAFPHRRIEREAGGGQGLVVTSTPSAGRATRARVLFQLLVTAARQSICINSPYFLPDRSMVRALCEAARRGVHVAVIVPDRQNNHPIARRASRRRYGALLRAGVGIHEYRPSMMHAKVLLVDQVWTVVGSTNFDNRSFGLNDEVNLAVQDASLAMRLERQFQRDLAHCHVVSETEWLRRPLPERVLAWLGAMVERQQ